MVRPNRDEFLALAERGKPVPVVCDVVADLDTPLALFQKIDDGETAFLFESMEGGEQWSRYSLLGLGARATFVARDGTVEIRHGGSSERTVLPADRSEDPLAKLRELLDELRPIAMAGLPVFAGGAVGFLSYDWVRYVERLPDSNPDPLRVPDAFFQIPEIVLVHDRRDHVLQIVVTAEPGPGESLDQTYAKACARLEQIRARLRGPVPEPRRLPVEAAPRELRSNVPRDRYYEIVKRAKEYIQAGDIFEVVPSQRFRLPQTVDPIAIYRQLRRINPSPYLFFLRAGGSVAVGSSPEILVRLSGDEIRLRPIAGTFPRGEDPAEDQRRVERLRSDPKERAEHLMLVDLGRNDVGRVALPGSVEVVEFEGIERYSHVMHLVSDVRGTLRPGLDAIDLLRATFPAGTLTGAPKVRAMEIIDELESERRGLYGGSVGYIDFRGNMDMCIAIRTMWIQDGEIVLQAGGGIVADSNPETEYEETLWKAGALFKSIERAQAEALLAPDEGSARLVGTPRTTPAEAGRGPARPAPRRASAPGHVLVIDNYDSFTFNLVQYLGELGAACTVVRNDAIGVEEIERSAPDAIVISPGPCTPREAGISVATVERCAGRIPLLGVCLGHQSIGAAYGGRIVAARSLMHGKTSQIHHDERGIFAGLPNPFEATRYHSLAIERASLPAGLEVSAWTDDGEIMAVRDRARCVIGVQFHPESILTRVGHDLLRNFLDLAALARVVAGGEEGA